MSIQTTTTEAEASAQRAAAHHGSADAALAYWMHIGRHSGGSGWREDMEFETALRRLVRAEAQTVAVAA